MVKKIATSLLLFAIAALFVLWFIADLRSNAHVGVWNFVIYTVLALLFIVGGVAVFLPDAQDPEVPTNDRGIQVLDDQTVVHDGVVMTVHQVALMDALRKASQLGSDATVRIGVDPATGQPRYDVVPRE